MAADARKFRRLAPLMMAELMREFGLADWRAAAIAGNAGHESGGFTIMQEAKPTVPGSRGGYGWFQWTGPRRRAYEAWCAGKNLDGASYEANVGFVIAELRGPEKAALAALRQAATFEAAVIAFERAYERAGVKHDDRRLRWARIALEEYRARKPNPKPLPQSRTAQGAAGAAAGGAAVIAEAVSKAEGEISRAAEQWSAGTWISLGLGALILLAALLALYARWDDAGRPGWPRRRVETAPVDGEETAQ